MIVHSALTQIVNKRERMRGNVITELTQRVCELLFQYGNVPQCRLLTLTSLRKERLSLIDEIFLKVDRVQQCRHVMMLC